MGLSQQSLQVLIALLSSMIDDQVCKHAMKAIE